jgi:phosphoribosylamine--glycine ligase
MPAVQDYKHAFEGDLGPETGGMGSVACGMTIECDGGSILTKLEFEKSVEIIERMIEGIQRETGERYHGVVAGQMMLTPVWGPTIIEMYSRFGDPENVNVLPLLETDLVEICEAIIDGKLGHIKLEFEKKATVVKAVAPKGYPERRSLAKGHPVKIDENTAKAEGVKCYWASIDEVEGEFVSGGSRLIEFLGIGESIPEASGIAERGVKHIRLLDGWETFHRKDIGSSKCLSRRLELANLARDIYQYKEKKGILGKRMLWLPGKGLIEAG